MYKSLFLLIVIVVLSFSSVADAQFEQRGIATTASASSSKPADTMRMLMTIEAQGATLQEAIETLAKKKKKATIGMEKLDAVEDSIQFEEIEMDEGGDTSTMMMRMRQMMGNDPRVAKMMEVKPPVKVKVSVTADWKIEVVEEPEKTFIMCDNLKQKIMDADLGGSKDGPELSEEQAELAEEMAEMMSNYGESETPAGTPRFYYVRTVTAEDHDKLISQAFSEAKTKAEKLAKTTGVPLGKLATVSSRDSDSMNDYSEYYGYGQRQAVPRGKTLDNGDIEVVGKSPIKLQDKAIVGVVFDIAN